MSPYDWAEGKSVNAVAAEDAGLMTASRVAKLIGHGLTATLIAQCCDSSEVHHTSKFFNWTGYYDPAEVADAFGLPRPRGYEAADPEEIDEPDDYAVNALRRHRETEPPGVIYDNASVEWLEWSGTRAHPRAKECKAEGCTVVVKGQTATVTLPDGGKLVKRLSTRGFNFYGKQQEDGHAR